MSNYFELTNTIPVPVTRTRGRKIKYPFNVMKTGESFFVPNIKSTTLYQAANKASKRLGDRKFTVRAAVERGIPGARVWRSA